MPQRQEPLEEVGGRRAAVAYSSRDAADMRRKRDVEGGREWGRFITVTLSAAVLYLGVMTMAAGRWTRSEAPTFVNFTTSAVTYARHTDIGFWEVCSCTLTSDAAYFCPAEQRLANAVGALTICAAFASVAAVVLFALDAFVLDDAWWSSYAVAGVVGFAGAATLGALIVQGARFGSTPCSGADSPTSYGIVHELSRRADRTAAQATSYSEADLVLHWGFGLLVVEAILLVGLAVLFVLRGKSIVRLWPLCFGGLLLCPVFVIVTASTNYGIASPGISTTGSENFNVGAWGACSCIASPSRCEDVAHSYRAVQAFAVIRLLLQVVQIALVAVLVPLVGNAVPRWLPASVGWCAWVASLICWTVAVGTFSACGCGDLHAGQDFDWPFAFEFVAFLLQTAVAGHLTWRFARRRLMEWAVKAHAKTLESYQLTETATTKKAGASSGLPYGNVQPPTAASPQQQQQQQSAAPNFDPYADTDSNASDAGSPPPRPVTTRDGGGAPAQRMAPRIRVKRREMSPGA